MAQVTLCCCILHLGVPYRWGNVSAAEPAVAGTPATQPSIGEQKMIRVIQCRDHLYQIGVGLVLFAHDHDGKFPPDLGTMAVEQHLDLPVFVCPAAPSSLPPNWNALKPKESADWINAHTDYIYLGNKRGITMTTNEPFVYEKDDDHGNGLDVLFGDLHVEFVPIESVHQYLGAKAGTERTSTRVAPAAGEAPAVPMITLEEAKAMYARLDLATLTGALDRFEMENGRYPTTAEGLKALVEKPGVGMRDWHQCLSGIPNDPWDHPYVYRMPGTGREQFDLFSTGPDGKPGTADDVKRRPGK